ncbi:MAG: translation initiation factor IF-2 subunit gamma, partial [Candidatus Woesearchaeota archaeon]
PQPQTKEHLMALEIVGIKNIVIVQNKIDLVSQEEALKNYNEIKNFIKGTIAEHAPIIPVSAQHNININFLIKAIEENIKTPSRDLTKDPIMFIARSFDINKPGSDIDKLFGGVLGGVIKQGVLKIKDKIEIKPGLRKEHSGKITYESIITTIEGLRSGEKDIKSAIPGGSIGILTKLDPFLVKSDNLTGNIVGLINKLPKVWHEFDLEHHLLKRVVGSKEDLNVEEIKKMEDLMLNVNSAATVGVVTEIKKNLVHVKLKIPVCAEKENRITISRRFGNRWRLIGYGLIKE